MRIHLAANYEGYDVAVRLRGRLSESGHDVSWHSAPDFDDDDDYPGMAIRALQATVADEDAGLLSRAIVIGGAGAGEVVAGNKVNGARVVSATDVAYVAEARRRADINGLVIPSFHVDEDTIDRLVAALMDTAFSSQLDDARRLVNVAEFETSGTIEGWMIER